MKSPAVVKTPEETGVPFFRSWKSLYLFVLVTFVLWVTLLVALTKMFS